MNANQIPPSKSSSCNKRNNKLLSIFLCSMKNGENDRMEMMVIEM